MKSYLSDSLPGVTSRGVLAALLLCSATARAADEPPPPPAARVELPESVVLPSTHVRDPEPEPDAVKVRIDGEYEARQSFLTPLPLASVDGSPASFEQTARLYHWLRLRGLALFGTHWEVRAQADVPRGMIYGHEPEAIVDSGSDFERIQPVRFQPRMLRATLRGRLGEVTLGHTTVQHGLGLVDADGDQPRLFGTPDRPPTYERLELRSGTPSSSLRVGASADLLFDDGRIGLSDGDHLLRAALASTYAPSKRSRLGVLARYESLQKRDQLGGAQTFLFDITGSTRQALPGRAGELFAEFEGAYRVGYVSEPTAFAAAPDQSLAALAFAGRAGVALERVQDFRRFAHIVVSLELGTASDDTDPTDDELHRFVMNPNHAVGSILFSEVLRFKTARAQARLGSSSRVEGLSTRGGVAGASYVNPVLLVRPNPDLALKLGAVVASATGNVVDPSAPKAAGRRNFDGGSPLGRALGTELDLGAELTVPLDAPMLLRLSAEGALAFPGSAFADAQGRGLGTQALTTVGLGLTF